MKRRHGDRDRAPSLRHVTAEHFRKRAKSYRYAAVLADDRKDVRRFSELASMFERMALKLCDRRKIEIEKISSVPATFELGQHLSPRRTASRRA